MSFLLLIKNWQLPAYSYQLLDALTRGF